MANDHTPPPPTSPGPASPTAAAEAATATASAWTQFRAMFRLRISLFQADIMSIIPFFAYPLVYIIILFAITSGSNFRTANAKGPPPALPYNLLVPPGPSYLTGSTADPAATTALFNQVNWTLTAHRQTSEGQWTASLNPNFWHRSNNLADVSAVTSKFLGTSSTLLDAKRPDLNPPLGGYIVHSFPTPGSPRAQFNVSLVANVNSGLSTAAVSPIMLNALSNAMQQVAPMPIVSPTAPDATRRVVQRLIVLVEQGKSTSAGVVVVPWSLQINAARAGFLVLPSEFFDLRAVVVPPLIVYCLYLMLLGSTRNLVGERVEGQFSYLVTNGLAPEVFFLSAIAAYTYLALMIILFSLILVLKTGWIQPLVLILLLVLFALYVTSQSALVSFGFTHKNTVPSTLYLIVFLVSVGPQVLIHQLGNSIPLAVDSTLTLIFPSYAVTQCLNDMSQAAFNGLSYRAFASHLPLSLLALISHIALNTAGACLLARHVALDSVGRAKTGSSPLAKVWAAVTGRGSSRAITHDEIAQGDEEQAASATPMFIDPQVLAEKQRLQEDVSTDQDVIRIRGLSKSFPTDRTGVPRKVLDDLWMSVRNNELFAFLGPNGAGKSTTIHILTGLLTPTAGSVDVCGHAPSSPATQRALGVCPQYDQAYAQLTVYHHLRALAYIKGVPEERVQEAINEALEAAELLPYKHRAVGALSGGTRRRMSIAIACLGRPAVVILDEPTTGVDVATRRSIWSMISRLKQHTSVLLVTHDMDEAERLAERAGILINGSLVCLGSPHRLKSLFGSAYVIKLQFAPNAVEAAVMDQVVDEIETHVKQARGGQAEQRRVRVVYRSAARMELAIEMQGGQGHKVEEGEGRKGSFVGDLLKHVTRQKTWWQVTDWSLGEVALGELFVRFAKQHRAYQNEEMM